MQERTKLDGLTAARFYAALMIVLFHLAAMPNLELPPYLQFIRAHFAIGVPLFFVVSAFSMFIGYQGKLQNADQVRNYAIRRYFRIAPLFYIMMAYFVLYRFWQYNVTTEWGHIITSATFTFNFLPQYASGYVWASWSIGVEMMFYLLVPAIVLAISTLARAIAFFALSAYVSIVWKAAFAGVTGSLVDLGNYFLAAHIIYFAGGILAYFAWLRVRHLRGVGLALLVAGIVSFVAMLAFRSQMARMGFAGATRLGQTVPLMLFVMGMAISPVSLLVNRFTTMMGETSFSLYLFHPALIGILMTGGFYKWIYKTVPDAGMAYAVCALATLAILFPAAFLGFKYIEVPGNRLGARLIAWLDRRNREPSRSEPGGKAERQATI